jgi:hypothetical protein
VQHSASSVRVTARQMARLHALLTEAREILDMDRRSSTSPVVGWWSQARIVVPELSTMRPVASPAVRPRPRTATFSWPRACPAASGDASDRCGENRWRIRPAAGSTCGRSPGEWRTSPCLEPCGRRECHRRDRRCSPMSPDAVTVVRGAGLGDQRHDWPTSRAARGRRSQRRGRTSARGPATQTLVEGFLIPAVGGLRIWSGALSGSRTGEIRARGGLGVRAGNQPQFSA